MTDAAIPTPRFRGPNTGIVATVFVLLFVLLFFAGLMPVAAFVGMPYFPGPTASVAEMVNFLETHPRRSDPLYSPPPSAI
jgi:hypothetical protein